MSDMIRVPKEDLASAATSEAPLFVPRIDVVEEPERFVLRADLPGCDPEAIDVQYENGSLTIRGRVPPRWSQARPAHREYGVGDFFRRCNVTESIDVERISAEYADGVLTLSLPKVESAKPRAIPVKPA